MAALIFGGVYVMRAIRTVLHGPLPSRWSNLEDASPWRRVPFVLLLTGLLVFGFFPRLLTTQIEPAAARVLQTVTAIDPDPTRSANTIADNAPLTIAAIKRAAIEVLKPEVEQNLKLVDEMVARCFASQDYVEGRTAFMEKRKPRFTGR